MPDPYERPCALHGTPIAHDPCHHVLTVGGRVVMTATAWQEIVEELHRLRTLEAALDDAKENADA